MKGLRVTQKSPRKGLGPPQEDLSGVRVTMIEPPFRVPHDFIDYPLFMNLGLLQNAAMLERQGAKVEVVDAVFSADALPLERFREGMILGMDCKTLARRAADNDPHVLVLHSSFFANPRYLDKTFLPELTSALRQLMPLVPILMADMFLGGLNYFPYEAAEIAQELGLVAVLRGETDAILGPAIFRVLDESFDGEVIHQQGGRAEGTFPSDLNAFPDPAFHLLPMERYFDILAEGQRENLVPEYHLGERILPMMSSRGCPYACIFCTQQVLDLSWRGYSAERLCSMMDGFRAQFGVERFLFLDDLMNLDGRRFKEFTSHMAQHEIPWDAVNGFRADRLNREVLADMKRAGNRKVTVSAESADPQVLEKIIRKGLEIEDIDRVARDAASLGYPCQIHYVIGFPGENRAAINRTLEHAARMRRDFGAVPLVQYATPVEGTRLFRTLDEDGGWADESARDTDVSALFYTDSVVKTGDFDPEILRQMRESFELTMRAYDAGFEPLKVREDTGEGEVSLDDVDAFLDSLPAHRRRVQLVGPDPLLHSELPLILRRLRSKGVKEWSLRTSGVYLTKAGVRKPALAAGLVDLCIDLSFWMQPDISERLFEGVGRTLEFLQTKGLSCSAFLDLSVDKKIDWDEIARLLDRLGLKTMRVQLGHYGAAEQGTSYLSTLYGQLKKLSGEASLRVLLRGAPACALSDDWEGKNPFDASGLGVSVEPDILECEACRCCHDDCLWRVGCSGGGSFADLLSA